MKKQGFRLMAGGVLLMMIGMLGDLMMTFIADRILFTVSYFGGHILFIVGSVFWVTAVIRERSTMVIRPFVLLAALIVLSSLAALVCYLIWGTKGFYLAFVFLLAVYIGTLVKIIIAFRLSARPIALG